ncbi:hypothetical protein ElyMa_002442300 [Elysia marginata]|uniref:Uncharacterized protein n=1 Tax=Elysia marginata TaxID=1093978 RepID=A0AAV4GJJ3_9GAST|nr:hypothetical protein ElyMa_002442300 [Elysia marginata]
MVFNSLPTILNFSLEYLLTSSNATNTDNSQAERSSKAHRQTFPQSGKYVLLTSEEKAYIVNWLKAIPTVPSHYCRKPSTYADKHFIFPGETLSSLHNDYQQDCLRDSVRAVERKYFTNVFKDLNMSFFHPRKDQCDKCISAKLGLVRREEHEAHV